MKNWFLNLKVKSKLTIAFSLLIVFMLAIGGIGLYEMSFINLNVKSFAENYLPSTDLLNQIDRDMQQATVAQRTMIFSVPGSDEFEALKKENNENINQAKERWGKYRQIEHGQEVTELYTQYETELDKWIKISGLIINSIESDTSEIKSAAIAMSLNEGKKAFESARGLIDKLSGINEIGYQENYRNSDASYDTAFMYIIIGMVIGLFFSILSGVLITKAIGNPLVKASNMMTELKKGHLSMRIKLNSRDEIGVLSQSMDTFADSLREFGLVMYAVADGDLSRELPLRDKDDEITPALNKIVYILRNLIGEVNTLTQSASDGKLSQRGDVSKYNGGYKAIVQGINETLDAIIAPVNEGVSALEQMATGDLTIRIKSQYKGDHQLIKNSINTVAESLGKTLLEVTRVISATSVSSNEISSSTEEIAAGAQIQSTQTGEVAAAIEQMTKTIVETTRNATAVAENAKKSGEIAGIGGKAVEDTVNGMIRIAEVVLQSSETVKQLGRNSDQIGEIIQVIDDIADQTNLLALNAAIEAARAGDQGRGFAVVADEVRKLAERTSKATREIADMIKHIQKDTSEAVVSMNKGTQEVEKGKELAFKAGESLKEIINATVKVVDDINQVACASEEQSSTAEQISKSIESISNVTNESSTGIQQVANTAEGLNRLTDNLQKLISNFKLLSEEKEEHYSVRQNGKLEVY